MAKTGPKTPWGKRHAQLVELSQQRPELKTADVAAALEVSRQNAAVLLHRACKHGVLQRKNKEGVHGYVYVPKEAQT